MIGRLLGERARASDPGAQVACTDGDGEHRWEDLERRAALQRAALETSLAGIGRVALLLPQRADVISLLAAVDQLGKELLVISSLYGVDRGRRHAAELGAGAFVRLEGSVPVVERLDSAMVDTGDPGILVLTSGTSGRPRCARHLWTTLTAAVKHDRHKGSRFFVGYPLAQFAGLQVLAQAVFGGGSLTIPPDFTPRTALALLASGADVLCATPSYVRQLLLAADVEALRRSGLKQVTLGGELADQRLLDGLRAALPTARLAHTYASTELGAVLTVHDGREGFDAALLDGERLRLVDGVLQVRRSPRSMVGYLGEPAPAAAGWVSTGDLVDVHDGRARFRGRSSDLFSVGGSKVNPIEVEQIVLEVPGVLEAVVSGHKSSILGAIPKALVRAAPDADRAALQTAIQAHCAARLPPHMVPRIFQFTEHIERSAAGKLRREGE